MVWPRVPSSLGCLEGPLAGLGIPLAEKRDDDLLNQPHLPVHGVAVEAQVTGLDPEVAELGRQVGHGQGILVEGGDTGHLHRLDEAEALQTGQLDLRQPTGGAQLLRRQTGTGYHPDRRGRGPAGAAPVPPAGGASAGADTGPCRPLLGAASRRPAPSPCWRCRPVRSRRPGLGSATGRDLGRSAGRQCPAGLRRRCTWPRRRSRRARARRTRFGAAPARDAVAAVGGARRSCRRSRRRPASGSPDAPGARARTVGRACPVRPRCSAHRRSPPPRGSARRGATRRPGCAPCRRRPPARTRTAARSSAGRSGTASPSCPRRPSWSGGASTGARDSAPAMAPPVAAWAGRRRSRCGADRRRHTRLDLYLDLASTSCPGHPQPGGRG